MEMLRCRLSLKPILRATQFDAFQGAVIGIARRATIAAGWNLATFQLEILDVRHSPMFSPPMFSPAKVPEMQSRSRLEPKRMGRSEIKHLQDLHEETDWRRDLAKSRILSTKPLMPQMRHFQTSYYLSHFGRFGRAA